MIDMHFTTANIKTWENKQYKLPEILSGLTLPLVHFLCCTLIFFNKFEPNTTMNRINLYCHQVYNKIAV